MQGGGVRQRGRGERIHHGGREKERERGREVEGHAFCVFSSESKVMYQQSFSANSHVEKFGQ